MRKFLILNMPPAEFGHPMAIGALISTVIILPMGKIMDIVHPLRVYFFSGLIVIAMIYAIQTLSDIPWRLVHVSPKQYGQFCSANSMVDNRNDVPPAVKNGEAADRNSLGAQ